MNKNDIAAAIEPQINQGLTIIAASFLLGVLFMYGIGYFIHLSAEMPPADAFNDGHLARTLAQITLIYFAITIPVSRILFKKFAKPGAGIKDPYLVVNNIRTGMLVQLALIEGAALLGAVSFLMGALDGYTQVNPIMWGTFLPLAYMVFHIILILPPKNYIVKMYEEHFPA
ncbi:MAG: hypothetical protein JJU41_07310 [Bacteroidetes bacterium]|nr:hypothetical protein [Bacteroidota bacterium]MCH8523383.1 hypothetical protein [Balneolales bacterium]